MRVGNVSVLIPEGRERDNGYVILEHNTRYRICLGNHYNQRRVDAHVFVDGKDVGLYRIDAGATVTLERSSHDERCFTFFAADSRQGDEAGAHKIEGSERGLLRVVFRAEKARPAPADCQEPLERACGFADEAYRSISRSGPSGSSFAPTKKSLQQPRGVEAGVTGLTGHSDQSFANASLIEYDPAEETTVNLRLVAGRRSGVGELTARPHANPVPPPVS